MQRPQRRQRKRLPAAFIGPQEVLLHVLQHLLLCALQTCRTSHAHPCAGGKCLHGGQQLQPQTIPQTKGLAVGRVLPPAFPCIPQGLSQFRPGCGQQRPCQRHAVACRHRAHPCQPFRAAAAKQMFQQRFRLIVLMMRQHHHTASLRPCCVKQRLIASFPCPSLPCAHGRRQPRAAQRKAVPLAQRLHKGLIAVAFRAAQPVIHMRRADRPAHRVPQTAQRQRQRHGIRAAGQGDHQPLSLQGRKLLRDPRRQLLQRHFFLRKKQEGRAKRPP